MLGIFKRKKELPKLPQLTDLNDNLLMEGDTVDALRYDLGPSVLLIENDSYVYKSLSSGKRVSWLKMIDASTDRQKVLKKTGRVTG